MLVDALLVEKCEALLSWHGPECLESLVLWTGDQFPKRGVSEASVFFCVIQFSAQPPSPC